MGIPVQKWQWPVNQIRPLGATCAACVKLHKDKTVLTFHQESVGKNFKRASYFVCFLHVEVGQVQGFCRKDIQYDKILNKASHPPSFQSSSSLFSESCVPQREEFQLSPLTGFLSEVEFGGAGWAHCEEATIDSVSQVTALPAHWTTRLLIESDGYTAKWWNTKGERGACQTVIDTPYEKDAYSSVLLVYVLLY